MAVEDSGTLATARVKLVADARGLPEDIQKQTEKGVGDAGEKAGTNFGKRMAAAIAAAVAVGTAVVGRKLVQGLKDSVAAASDLNEVTSKSAVVFGKSAKEVQKFADTASTRLGQSKKAALDAATTFAVFGKGAKLTGKDLSKFSTGLVSLASDMASFSNTSPEEAVDALGSAMRGEFDPIEKYGVLLNETTVKNEALKLGLIDNTKNALTPQQRVLAVHAAVLKQTKDAQGDFARTSAGLANQQRIASAEVQNLKARIGASLLPTVIKLTQIFNTQVIPAFNALWAKHGPAIARVFETVGAKVGAFAAQLAQGDFSSEIEKARDAFDRFKDAVVPALKNFATQVGPAAQGVKENLVPALKQLKEDGGQSLADAVNVGAIALRFLADHSDLLAKSLPYLVAAIAAFKVAQLASNVAMAASPAIRLLEIQATRKQTAAIVANTAAREGETGATVLNTAALTGNAAAENVGILARIRATAVTVAQRAVTIATTAATWLATAATTALGVAIKFATGPIGIIITIIAALVAIIIYAYKHNETFRKIVDAVWKAIKTAIKATVDWFVNTAWPWLKRRIDETKLAFQILWAAIKEVWSRIKDHIQKVLDTVFGLFNKLKTFITQTIPNAFKTGVAAIGRFWHGLQELARKPIVFVVGIVNKLIGGYNKIASVFKAPTAPTIPGFADGGLIPGTPSDVDNLMAEGPRRQAIRIATGEYIVNARSTAKNLPLLNAINSKGFADGGLFGTITGFFTDPAGYFKKIMGSADAVIDKFGNSGLGRTLVGMGNALLKSVIDRAQSFFTKISGIKGQMFGAWPASPAAQRGDSGVWRGIVALIRSTGPISGKFGNAYRPGDPLWHGSGRAVDWMGYNQDVLATLLALKHPLELIHRTNRRDYAYTRGVNKGSFNNALMEAHRNHIHIAFAKGGYFDHVPPMRKYDMGGWWPSGTLGINTSGRSEHVTTGSQHDEQSALLARIAALLEELAPAIGNAVGRTLVSTVPAAQQAARQAGRRPR